jgi:hypothetical protein
VDDPNGSAEKILQYWFFYYDNPKTFGVGPFQYFEHEGDWEMIQVRLGSDDGIPLNATYAQHEGAVNCSWILTEKTLWQRPIVYVALGSHASYFHSGDHTLYYNGVPTPYSDSANGLAPPVTPAVIDITSAPPWVSWIGRWGASDSSPRSPDSDEHRTQWSYPFLWQGAPECTTSSFRPGAGSASSRRPALAAGRPPLPSVHARREGKQVVIDYIFQTFPAGPGMRPWMILTSVDSAGRKFPPLTHETLIRSRRRDRITQSLGLADLHSVFWSAFARLMGTEVG